MNSMNCLKKVLPDVVAVVLFLVVAFAYFMGPIGEGRVLNGHDVVASVGQGRELSDFRSQTGETTRWTNTVFSGMPTWQISPSYESSSVLSVVQRVLGLGTTGALNYVFLYLLGFYILLRAFGQKPWVSALGAVLWAFSSYFFIIIAAGHIWKVLTLAFIPPTIAGLVLCYRGKLLWGGVVTALFTALQVHSNHVQMSYYFAFLMGFVVLAYAVEAVRRKRTLQWAKATGVLVLAGVVGLLANFPNLYHTYDYAKYSLRGRAELSPLPGQQAKEATGGLDRDYITQWSYGVDETWTLLIPDFKGGGSGSIIDDEAVQGSDAFERFYQSAAQAQQALQQSGLQVAPPGLNRYWGDQPFTVGPVYVGAFVCFLFVLGLFFVRGPMKWALLASAVLSFLFAWGHNDPAFTNFCIDHLPLYNKFRTPSSALVVAEFAIPLLAVLCLAQVMRRPADLLATRRGKAGLAAAGVLTAGVCLLLWMAPGLAGDCLSAQDAEAFAALVQPLGAGFVQGYRSAVTDMHHALLSASALRSFLYIALGAVCLLAYVVAQRRTEKPSPVAGAALCGALLLICLGDMWSVNKRYLNDDSFDDPVVVQAVQPTAADQAVLKDTADYRVLNLSEGNPFNETSNRTAYFHQSIGGYNPAKLHRYQDLVDRRISNELPALVGAINEAQGDMVQVKGDSLAPVLNMLNAKYIIFGQSAAQAVANPYANGNGWFVGRLQFVKGADAEMAALQSLDTKHAAVADEAFRAVLDGSPLDSGSVRLLKREANAVSYEVTTQKGGLAVFSEIYYPGWTATLDDRPAEVGRVNYVLRALKVPAGTHRVTMEYKPSSVAATEAVAFTALALILLTALLAIWLGWKRRKAAQAC